MKLVKIYALIDPETYEVRYVGKTTNLKRRLNRHLNESRKSTSSHKKAWWEEGYEYMKHNHEHDNHCCKVIKLKARKTTKKK
jgi:hypothetical protein